MDKLVSIVFAVLVVGVSSLARGQSQLPTADGSPHVLESGPSDNIINPVLSVESVFSTNTRVSWIDLTYGHDVKSMALPSMVKQTICATTECHQLAADGPGLIWTDRKTLPHRIRATLFIPTPATSTIWEGWEPDELAYNFVADKAVFTDHPTCFSLPCLHREVGLYEFSAGTDSWMTSSGALSVNSPFVTSYLGDTYYAYVGYDGNILYYKKDGQVWWDEYYPELSYGVIGNPVMSGQIICWDEEDSTTPASDVFCRDFHQNTVSESQRHSECLVYARPRLSGLGRYVVFAGYNCTIGGSAYDSALWINDRQEGKYYLVDTNLITGSPVESHYEYRGALYDVRGNEIVYVKRSGAVTALLIYRFDESQL